MKNFSKNKIMGLTVDVINNLMVLERRTINTDHKKIIADIRAHIEKVYNNFITDPEDYLFVNVLKSNLAHLMYSVNDTLSHVFVLRRTNILRASNKVYNILTNTKGFYTKNILFTA